VRTRRPPKHLPAQQPKVRIILLRRSRSEDATTEIETVYAAVDAQSKTVPGGLEWTACFEVPSDKRNENGVRWSVFAEEVERMRPATYRDEPRYRTASDTAFAETGPRFAARIALDDLWKWLQATPKWKTQP
jgi:hypothetical protein